MKQKNETIVLILSLLVIAGILGGGYWWFTQQSNGGNSPSVDTNQSPTPNETMSSTDPLSAPPSPSDVPTFDEPQSVPSGTTVRIDGSTSMARINEVLKKSFEERYPGTSVVTNTNGSNNGIKDLLAGKIDLAAISRPLTAQEQEQGLVAIPVAKDAIALIVGDNSLFPRGTSLKQDQIVGIFQGTITNWSAVGGKPGTIRVINRPAESGTYSVFRDLVLQGDNFGQSPNITSWPKDETTPIMRDLRTDGISYATYAQVRNQKTVRIVPVDNQTPNNENYPYTRTLSYVYKKPESKTIEYFLGYTGSPTGQSVIATAQ